MLARRTPLVFFVLAALLAGCTAQRPPEPLPPAVRWTAAALPVQNATVRDIARCGDSWLAVGAIRLGNDPTAAPNEQREKSFEPAAWWRGPDGQWRQLTMKPVSYYGERAVLRSAACRSGVIVAVGGASGGAHGNSRVTTWHGTSAEGALAENPPTDFELFGGDSAIGVGQIAAGPTGFAIAGNWLDGQRRASPAIWFSADGRGWNRLPDDPTRSSTGTVAIRATDMYADDNGYLLAGEQLMSGQITPYLLRSSEGRAWARVAVPHDGGLLKAGPVLVGTLGKDVLVWRDGTGQWAEAGGFVVDAGPVPAQSGGSGRFGTHTAVAACGGSTCGVWAATDDSTSWARIDGPPLPPVQPSTTFRLATDGTKMLLLSDNGTNTQIFLGEPAH